MISRRALLATMCLLFPFMAAQTLAADATPTATVALTIDSVIEVLRNDDITAESKKRQINKLVSSYFDFRAMSSRVLATNWKSASPQQQRKFTSLFKELLINRFWQKISAYDNETVEYIAERMRNPDLATVRTLIRTATVDIPVDYKLYFKNSKQWLAYDVVIEQVSLVRNYRGRFQKIVHDKGIDGLITQLQLMVAQSSVAQVD